MLNRESQTSNLTIAALANVEPAKAEQAGPSVQSADQPSSTEKFQLSAEERHHMIAKAAYFRAELRGFTPGHELADWLEAEAELDRLMAFRD
jgi:Protein of unknown function (DUF2934)